MSMADIGFRKITANFGVAVHGLDLRAPLSDAACNRPMHRATIKGVPPHFEAAA
jgi:hypothetical protein